MRVEIQLRIVGDDGTVISDEEVLRLDKAGDRLEAVGLSLAEAKTLLADVQDRMVAAQAGSLCGPAPPLPRLRPAAARARALTDRLPHGLRRSSGCASPRLHPLRLPAAEAKTFSPLNELFTEHTAPELLYLETQVGLAGVVRR